MKRLVRLNKEYEIAIKQLKQDYGIQLCGFRLGEIHVFNGIAKLAESCNKTLSFRLRSGQSPGGWPLEANFTYDGIYVFQLCKDEQLSK